MLKTNTKRKKLKTMEHIMGHYPRNGYMGDTNHLL